MEAFNTNENLEKKFRIGSLNPHTFHESMSNLCQSLFGKLQFPQYKTMVYVEIECSLAATELCNRRKDSMFKKKT